VSTAESGLAREPQPAMRQRCTRIIATLGPACASFDHIGELMCAGADIFRINASHTDVDTQAQYIDLVRKSSRDCDVHIGILLDLQGPKIRLGAFRSGSVCVAKDESFRITTQDVMGNAAEASTTYENFAHDVRPGDRVLLADGAVELTVLDSDGISAVCRVIRGGTLCDHQGINLPGTNLSAPSVTEKDRHDLEQGLRQHVDMIALSFVRCAADIWSLRETLSQRSLTMPIIAKIERPEAWERIDEIIQASDGVMVARGDLGVEMSMGEVPHIQKAVIEKARQRNRFTITATQMLESMMDSPVPTRAEVSDITNAVYDGTDALMLSGETAKGRYPAEAVRTMSEIARVAELHSPIYEAQSINKNRIGHAEVIADAACRMASSGGIEAIVVFTETGRTAHLIAARRPIVPILAFAPTDSVARQLSAWFGITALVAPTFQSLEKMTEYMDREIIARAWIQAGNHILFVAGDQLGRSGATNMLKVHPVSGG
jgi:pyruvate kinase